MGIVNESILLIIKVVGAIEIAFEVRSHQIVEL